MEASATFQITQINPIFAWVWILLGIIAGFILGINFHKEDWLGGYTSLKRRLYRLSHISFFGLAIINLLFYFTTKGMNQNSANITTASLGFIVGGFTMPFCCIIMANNSKLRALFLIPVISLTISAIITLFEVINR